MFTIAAIKAAHSLVKSGTDFPKYIQAIKQLGVVAYETSVSDSHTEYYGADNFHTKSDPMYAPLSINEKSDKEQFAQYLKTHQEGKTDYPTFCKHCAETGIEKWRVSTKAMTCTYYDKAGKEVLKELIPS